MAVPADRELHGKQIQSHRPGRSRWLPFSGLALLCFCLVACGGGSGGSGGAPPPAPAPSISLDPTNTNITLNRADMAAPSNVFLNLRNTTTTGLVIFGDYTKFAIVEVLMDLRDPTSVRLVIRHRPPSTFFNGTYTDRITINACLDQACNQPLNGSPLTIPITHTIVGTDPATGETGPAPDADAMPLEMRSRVALAHDVRDAEYSRSLDRIVMAATYPTSALYVYDAATGTEKSLPLAKPPTAVSVSPDGLKAAVGHDGLISIVDLAQVGQQPAQVPFQLTVSDRVFDLALDGQGRVHFIPDHDQPANIHTVDIATGTDRLGGNILFVYGQTYLRLHPSGNYLFLGDPAGSTSVDKWDITGPAATYVTRGTFDLPYLRACGPMWFNESGARVYSQCGHAFETDGPPNLWLQSPGRLELSGPATTQDAYTISWMDHWAARNEIALIEANAPWCNKPEFGMACYNRLGIFDSETLTRQSIHALGPVTVNGTRYVQQGLFVFYKADGTRKFLLSRLYAMSDPAAEYHLSVLD